MTCGMNIYVVSYCIHYYYYIILSCSTSLNLARYCSAGSTRLHISQAYITFLQPVSCVVGSAWYSLMSKMVFSIWLSAQYVIMLFTFLHDMQFMEYFKCNRKYTVLIYVEKKKYLVLIHFLCILIVVRKIRRYMTV